MIKNAIVDYIIKTIDGTHIHRQNPHMIRDTNHFRKKRN